MVRPPTEREKRLLDAEATSLLLLARLRKKSSATYESGAGALAAQFVYSDGT